MIIVQGENDENNVRIINHNKCFQKPELKAKNRIRKGAKNLYVIQNLKTVTSIISGDWGKVNLGR